MDKEARLRNCHDQGGWGLMTAEGGSLGGPWDGKGTSEEELVKSEHVWSLVNSHAPMPAGNQTWAHNRKM